MTTPLADRIASALAGRYAVEREVGRGAMATVYRARDLRHGRDVAIKVLSPELAAAVGVDRFLAEIRTTAALQHPNILPLFDSGEVPGTTHDPGPTTLYYVMPYVAGESLRARLEREGTLPVSEALRLAAEIAEALEHAHRRGIVHRDVKPENVLIQEGRALVADFGIALATDPAGDRITATGLMVGTPAYASPEQAAGSRSLDARSDVYSLACVLYEMLAGEAPHAGPTPQATIAKRFVDPPPRVRRVRPAVPLQVEDALLRALAADPADRFATAAEFAAALTAPATRRAAEPPSRRGAGPPSVAVLPFLSIGGTDDVFADGITEDVIAQLAKIRALKVIARSSAAAFRQRQQDVREIGAALGVATVLDGSVRRAGERVRVVAQLVDAATSQSLWAETYDRQLTDIFAIQSDVALRIAGALQAELTGDEVSRIGRQPTADLRAYQLYLQGRFSHTRGTADSLRRAVAYYREAIAADPGFALPYVGIAHACEELVSQGDSAESPAATLREASDAIDTALALDPDLGEAHSALGTLRMMRDFDWPGAEAELKAAVALSPGAADVYEAFTWICGATERYDEAVEMARRAQELDPVAHRADLPTTLLRAGRYEEALAAALRGVAFDPAYARGRGALAWAYLQLGRMDEGIAELEAAMRLAPENTMYLGQLGQAYALAGRDADAREALHRLEQLARERYVAPYHFAYVHTGLGEHDRAMDYLEQAFEQRAGSVWGIKGSFLFAPLRGHPRFEALLRRMNLA